MRLLLDSHVALAVVRHELAHLGKSIENVVASVQNDRAVSAATLWEIAIKHRLGKLLLPLPLADFPAYLRALGIELLAVDDRHAVEDLRQWPATRDPFDRLLLAQCQVENLTLVTVDRALAAHPLAWRAP